MGRGYFAIGIFHVKKEVNIGTLWRSAVNFQAAFLFTIGRRYRQQASDTCKSQRHIPIFHYQDFEDFQTHRPIDCALIGIETGETSRPIETFRHPHTAVYLLGAEDYGLPPAIQECCQSVVRIGTPYCLNVASAGSIVMYDRSCKR